MSRAVVFAYHNVGVRCLSVLLAGKVDVPLVVTHDDSADENIWFESVAALAEEHNIPFVTPDDPNRPDIIERIRDLAPEFIFSFYYRRMLGAELLACASRGALNMHGSLLPKYRGRAPVNWADAPLTSSRPQRISNFRLTAIGPSPAPAPVPSMSTTIVLSTSLR